MYLPMYIYTYLNRLEILNINNLKPEILNNRKRRGRNKFASVNDLYEKFLSK